MHIYVMWALLHNLIMNMFLIGCMNDLINGWMNECMYGRINGLGFFF